MSRVTITITESVTRTYQVSPEQLEELDLPTNSDELREHDEDDLATELIESDLEDRYEVTDRSIQIEAALAPNA